MFSTRSRPSVSQLQAEVESLALRLFYTREVNSDLRSDIAAMKNASRKADAEKTQAEDQKYKQDLYVERLTKHMERLTEQISMYEVQTLAQSGETKAAKEALAEVTEKHFDRQTPVRQLLVRLVYGAVVCDTACVCVSRPRWRWTVLRWRGNTCCSSGTAAWWACGDETRPSPPCRRPSGQDSHASLA